MARSRMIRPSIMTNEDLCGLGPYAYILFTGLWMLADREGRLEYRPARIKAEAMPLWELPVENSVENLLKSLSTKGFIHIYKTEGLHLIAIVNWKKHQACHQRESASVLPPPPPENAKSSRQASYRPKKHSLGAAKDEPRHSLGSVEAQPRSPLSTSTSTSIEPPSGGSGKFAAADPEPDPDSDPPEPPPEVQPPAAKPRPNLERKGPHVNGPPGGQKALDWSPHKPEDVDIVRRALDEIAQIARLPKADDGILHQVLDKSRGAPGAQVYRVLRELYLRRKFDGMNSWGLIPMVVADWFKAA